MSRAGVGKNESSAGKRVIVAKGSGGGQGRAGQKGTMPLAVDIGGMQLGGRYYHGNMWAMGSKPSTGQVVHGVGGRSGKVTAVRI